MNIPSESLHQTADKNAVLFLETPAEKIVFLQALFESYEGVGIVRTMDRANSIISILTTSDMLHQVVQILESLKGESPWRYCTTISDEWRQKYIAEL